jgi:cytochrome c oxidase subunit 4
MQDLIILSHDEYKALRRTLQEIDVDLCYSASSARPLRMRWAHERAHDKTFRQAIAARRPADGNFRIASVEVTKPGKRWWPDQLAITFYAASEAQDVALQTYLTTERVGVPAPTPVEHKQGTAEHAASFTYIQIALILAVLTALEVTAFYLPDAMRPPGWMLVIVLILLSVVKFGLVASYFMHLRYDHRLYASCFAAGLVVATGTILALVTLFREPSNLIVATADARTPVQRTMPSDTSHGRAVATPPPMRSEAGNANAGSGVFEKYGCGACHTVTTLPAARGNIGPALDGLTQRAALRVPDMGAADYIRQSIMEPGAYMVKGYLKLMPSLRTAMSDQEFNDLVAWLQAL